MVIDGKISRVKAERKVMYKEQWEQATPEEREAIEFIVSKISEKPTQQCRPFKNALNVGWAVCAYAELLESKSIPRVIKPKMRVIQALEYYMINMSDLNCREGRKWGDFYFNYDEVSLNRLHYLLVDTPTKTSLLLLEQRLVSYILLHKDVKTMMKHFKSRKVPMLSSRIKKTFKELNEALVFLGFEELDLYRDYDRFLMEYVDRNGLDDEAINHPHRFASLDIALNNEK